MSLLIDLMPTRHPCPINTHMWGDQRHKQGTTKPRTLIPIVGQKHWLRLETSGAQRCTSPQTGSRARPHTGIQTQINRQRGKTTAQPLRPPCWSGALAMQANEDCDSVEQATQKRYEAASSGHVIALFISDRRGRRDGASNNRRRGEWDGASNN